MSADVQAESLSEPLTIGRIGAAYGVRGWNHVKSFLEPAETLFEYEQWLLAVGDTWELATLADFRRHNNGLVVQLEGSDDRDAAQLLAGTAIAMPREALPKAEGGEFYWHDLVGCVVVTRAGEELGSVEALMETGANDVMVVGGERERLVPFILDQVVITVDLDACRIVVDWHPED